jgi:hypothetical protein
VAGSCEYGNEPSGSITGSLLVSQEDVCSMSLVSVITTSRY